MDWNQYNTDKKIDVYSAISDLYSASKFTKYQEEYKIQAQISVLEHSSLSDLENDSFEFIKISDIDINYCKSRLDEDISDLLRWRYYVMLFMLENSDWLEKAISLIIQSAEKQQDELQAATYLAMAFNFNKKCNLGKDKLINKIALNCIRKKGKFLYFYVHMIDKLKRQLKTDKKIIKEIQDIVLEVSKTQTYTGFERSLNAIINLVEGKDKKPIQEELVKRFEQLAKEQTEPLLKKVYYDKAISYCQDETDIERFVYQNEVACDEISMTPITAITEIQKINICGESNSERLEYLISLFKSNIPKKTNDTKQNYLLSLDRISSIYSISVEDCEDKGEITVEDYMNYLKECNLHEKSILELIERGIQSHYAKDYISSIHILTAQIENTIRSLLKLKNQSTPIKTKGKTLMEATLYDLIDCSVDILNDDFIEFLKVKIASPEYCNLRNKIYHSLYEKLSKMEGFNPLHDFTHETFLLVILTIMLLTSLYE